MRSAIDIESSEAEKILFFFFFAEANNVTICRRQTLLKLFEIVSLLILLFFVVRFFGTGIRRGAEEETAAPCRHSSKLLFLVGEDAVEEKRGAFERRAKE